MPSLGSAMYVFLFVFSDLMTVNYIGNGFQWENEPENSSAKNMTADCICSQLFGDLLFGKA
jgi:hypothetical protein